MDSLLLSSVTAAEARAAAFARLHPPTVFAFVLLLPILAGTCSGQLVGRLARRRLVRSAPDALCSSGSHKDNRRKIVAGRIELMPSCLSNSLQWWLLHFVNWPGAHEDDNLRYAPWAALSLRFPMQCDGR